MQGPSVCGAPAQLVQVNPCVAIPIQSAELRTAYRVAMSRYGAGLLAAHRSGKRYLYLTEQVRALVVE